ncbi:EF hand, partial [Oesophagostomum dentatum]
LLVLAALCIGCLGAPVPLEEEFNLPGFNAKQENHEEKFLRVDGNRDKRLDFNEFLHSELAYVDAKKEEFASLDKDKDGIVTQKEYEEHYHGVTSRSEARRSEYFAKVFQDFDEDFDMSLNQGEMERVLAERFLVKPRENFPKLFYSFDHDHSGGLDLTEDGIVTQKEYEEHYHGVTSRSEARRSEYFAKVFQDFDEDFDMSLNQGEMERVLAERFLVKPRENFPKLFYSFDHDHSG